MSTTQNPRRHEHVDIEYVLDEISVDVFRATSAPLLRRRKQAQRVLLAVLTLLLIGGVVTYRRAAPETFLTAAILTAGAVLSLGSMCVLLGMSDASYRGLVRRAQGWETVARSTLLVVSLTSCSASWIIGVGYVAQVFSIKLAALGVGLAGTGLIYAMFATITVRLISHRPVQGPKVTHTCFSAVGLNLTVLVAYIHFIVQDVAPGNEIFSFGLTVGLLTTIWLRFLNRRDATGKRADAVLEQASSVIIAAEALLDAAPEDLTAKRSDLRHALLRFEDRLIGVVAFDGVLTPSLADPTLAEVLRYIAGSLDDRSARQLADTEPRTSRHLAALNDQQLTQLALQTALLCRQRILGRSRSSQLDPARSA